MSGAYIIGKRPGILHGTINAAGTLSEVIDKSDWDLAGLIVTSTMGLGTLNLFAGHDGGTLYPITGSDGATLAIGPVSGTFAVSSVVLEPLRAYRYVAIGTTAQEAGLAFKMPVRA